MYGRKSVIKGTDLVDFEVPSDQLPDTDQLSKAILKTARVVDIVASELLDVPGDAYTAAGTEWPNGSRCDVLYVPRVAIVPNSLPPI